MDRARIHEGIRRITDVLGRSERSELSQMEAAELLGISERTFRRWRDRHLEAGLVGLADPYGVGDCAAWIATVDALEVRQALTDPHNRLGSISEPDPAAPFSHRGRA
jgi:Homeodomain-like domain